MTTEQIILVVQIAQLAGMAYGLVKIGQWVGRVGARQDANDMDHRRYERHLEVLKP